MHFLSLGTGSIGSVYHQKNNSALVMLWPSGDEPAPSVRTDLVPGYGPQCSQLYNTIEHTWTEAQWSVWESLRKDMNC